MSSHHETVAGNQSLQKILAIARTRGDVAIAVIAAVMLAFAYLRSSNSTESLERAQSFLAIARSHQLDETLSRLPQLTSMIHFVDLLGSLQHFNPNQAITKMQAMHTVMVPAASDDMWQDDGTFAVPLKQDGPSDIGSGGIVSKNASGKPVLSFEWIPRGDVYALAYLLSGSVISHRNSTNGQKAEKYFREGLRMAQGIYMACPIANVVNLWSRS